MHVYTNMHVYTYTRMLMDIFSHPILQSSLGDLVYQLFKKKKLLLLGQIAVFWAFPHSLLYPITNTHLSHGAITDQSLTSLPAPGSKEPLLDVHESLELYICWMLWALVREHEVWDALRFSWHSNNVWKRGLQLTLKTFLISQTIRSTTATTQMGIFSKPNYVGD